VETRAYAVEAGNARTPTVRESVPPVLLNTHVLYRGPAGFRSRADRMFNP